MLKWAKPEMQGGGSVRWEGWRNRNRSLLAHTRRAYNLVKERVLRRMRGVRRLGRRRRGGPFLLLVVFRRFCFLRFEIRFVLGGKR